MKDILIKYGITLSESDKSQKESFDRYANDAKNQNLKAFNDFLELFERSRIGVKASLDEVYKETDLLITEAIRLTENAITDSSSSLLSAFGAAIDENEFEKKHVNLLLGLANVISDLNIPACLCAKIISDANDGLLVELTLRHVALNEFWRDAELCRQYTALVNTREDLSCQVAINHAYEYSNLISNLVNDTKTFCQNFDAVFEKIKTKTANQILYSRAARDYISLIHEISLKLREIKGDTNAKI